MEQDIQSIFNRIQESKKKMKEFKVMYRDALESNGEYKEIQDKMKTMRENKKRIETAIKEGFSGEMQKLDDLKIDVESDMELLNDMALTKVIKGEAIELSDEYKNNYEPVFSVKFKKSN